MAYGRWAAMVERQPSREAQIVRGILQYLHDHPQAKDTVEGISQWWLPREAGYTTAEVDRAVTQLISEGLIVTTQRKGSPQCYAANPSRLGSISKFLKGS